MISINPVVRLADVSQSSFQQRRLDAYFLPAASSWRVQEDRQETRAIPAARPLPVEIHHAATVYTACNLFQFGKPAHACRMHTGDRTAM